MGMMTRRNKRARAVKNTVLTQKKKSVEVRTEDKKEVFYTKTDINTMKVADLRELAKQQGITNADDISGTELKNILIEKMGL